VATSKEKIRIRMEAYDHEVLDRTAQEIVLIAHNLGLLLMDLSPSLPVWSGIRFFAVHTLTENQGNSSKFEPTRD